MSAGFGEDGFEDDNDDYRPRRPVWRGRGAPRPGGPHLTRANDAIRSTLIGNDLARGLRPHMAKAIWARVVGPQVASVTQAVAIRGGDVLVVRTKNSIWANELTLLKDDILKRLNRALGGSVLSDIYFGATGLRSDEPAIPSQTVQEETPKPQPDEVQGESLSPRKILEIEEKVKAIRDPQLRSRLRDNLIRMAQADEWKRQNGWKCCEACGTLAYPREDKPGPHLCDVCRVKQMRRR